VKNFLEKVLAEKNARPREQGLVEKKEGGARIAIYDSLASAPRVVELSRQSHEEFINVLSTKTYQFSQEKGGRIPFTVIKELIENLIHAHFNEIVITILDGGNTIKISDQGPGIKDKERVFWPGFSTADQEMKKIIKGVGSGLPIIKEVLGFSGGSIKIEDNLGSGTVITIALPLISRGQPEKIINKSLFNKTKESPQFNLSNRQKKVLFLVAEMGPMGPSRIAEELNIGLSTAYRDLLFLEEFGLIKSDERGKRNLTQNGIKNLEVFFKL